VRFYARGNGRYAVNLGTDQTRAENNHYSKEITITSEWKLYELPFVLLTQTWGEAKPWDPSTIFFIGFNAVASPGTSGQIFVDNLEFYLKDEGRDPNIIIPVPKINQEGYLTVGKKYFCINTNTASQGDPFYIRNSHNDVVFTGTISGTPLIDTASTGEEVWKVDFSELSTPDTYTISVNNKESHSFTISDSVYNRLFRDALRCFYLIRCGLAENDPITGINRLACHLNDALVRGGTGNFDATGGWHNAGDLGKYVNETALSVTYMLWLCEIKPDMMKGMNIQIPESGTYMSYLLSEAKWGLTWLLKMQKADSTVYHKVDSEPYLFGCGSPDLDPYDRYAEFQKATEPQIPSTVDAGDFTGVMALAARVFESVDNAFSATCLEAAKKTWAWLSTHPAVGQGDPYYVDPDSWQKYLWAEGEMARTLNSGTLRSAFSAAIDTVELNHASWGEPHLF
jgi:endoglucanase